MAMIKRFFKKINTFPNETHRVRNIQNWSMICMIPCIIFAFLPNFLSYDFKYKQIIIFGQKYYLWSIICIIASIVYIIFVGVFSKLLYDNNASLLTTTFEIIIMIIVPIMLADISSIIDILNGSFLFPVISIFLITILGVIQFTTEKYDDRKILRIGKLQKSKDNQLRNIEKVMNKQRHDINKLQYQLKIQDKHVKAMQNSIVDIKENSISKTIRHFVYIILIIFINKMKRHIH